MMSTTIRPEVSKKNPYWIERHRYYELKHFCLQYPIWQKAYISLGGLVAKPDALGLCRDKYKVSNPTERIAITRSEYADKMRMVEKAAKESNGDIANYVLMGVTRGLSYTSLTMLHNIPCCRETYYNAYRKFFWLLNKIRS